MTLLDGEGFRTRIKSLHAFIKAQTPQCEYQAFTHEMTRRIIEFHYAGYALLTMNQAKLLSENDGFRVDYSACSLTHELVEVWEKALNDAVLALR